ncbi:MAG: carboxypeptidase-like regulatory domain-containing protein, partial [Gemmatimonadota bacterium]|nr:carboxypeptidase-like regulatory domain-containing protein [Gemmatimonadota bacterium]
MRGSSLTALVGALSLAALTRLPPVSVGLARHQPSTVLITVSDAGAGYPLANADVVDLSSGHHTFTDQHGRARSVWPADGQLRLRIREIGYKPVERTLRRAEVVGDAATITLSRVAYVIAPVRSTSLCATNADSVSQLISVSALEQLQQAAEKYAEFRRTYPFEAQIERRTARVPENGEPKRITSESGQFRSENLEKRYRPSDIVEYVSGGFNVPVLFLSTLADSVFWEHHCYIVRGVDTYQGTRALRLEFSPNIDVHGPDWEGTALLDSATSYILRVDFRVANLDPNNVPKRIEGYTTFASPSPFVIMPDTTFGVWW